MVFQKKAAPGNPANVARMVAIGQPVAPEPQPLDFGAPAKVVRTVNDNPQLTEGNPDPAALKATEQLTPEQAPNVAPVTPDNAAPEADPDGIDDQRFKGKARKDLYDAYKNLESEKGRMANELGMIRKTFDLMVQKQGQVTPPEPPKPDPKRAADLLNMVLTDPEKFLETAEQRVHQRLTATNTQQQILQLESQHQNTINDPAFGSWVTSNVDPDTLNLAARNPSTYRMILRQFENERGAQSVPPLQPPSAPATPSNQRVVQVGVAGSTGPVGRPPASGNQTYRRSDIITLINQNPDEYKRRLPEITKAYQEGRVINE